MHPKIYEKQHLKKPTFRITGPVDDGTGGDYDDGLAMAITFVVTQKQEGDNVAKGVGKADGIYTKDDKGTDWSGEVKVADGVQFRPGQAGVSAFAAIVTDEGGWELYPWGLTVTLISP